MEDLTLTKYKLPDEEILGTIDKQYYEENIDAGLYELQKLTEQDEFNLKSIGRNIKVLKQQQKVISKRVLQLILDQRNRCTEEFNRIDETEKLLSDSVETCQRVRSHLNYAKKQLTTCSLEIIAGYRKREIILNLLKILRILKDIKTADQVFQQLIQRGDFSAGIQCLLETKAHTETFKQYKCIDSYTQKIQDSLMLTEVQLDQVLNSCTYEFNAVKYGQLQDAYSLLGKPLIAMDQLHMNFISSIHSSAFSVLKKHIGDSNAQQKLVFEQLCESITVEKYVDCLIDLCKAFWKIIVCYQQVVLWHQERSTISEESNNTDLNNDYAHQKLTKGQIRIWNDIQTKVRLYVNSSKIQSLKYEQFIQILSVIHR